MSKFLVTNDDGYQSPLLHKLIEHLKKYGEIVCVAPLVEQSATSQRITIHAGLKVRKLEDYHFPFYTVEGSPADCIRIGLTLHPEIDFIISGINNGSNIGHDANNSGTVGAILQGRHHGYNGIAFSTPWRNSKAIDAYLDQTIKHLFDITCNIDSFLLNVNFPADCSKQGAIKATKVATGIASEEFEIRNGSFHIVKFGHKYENSDDEDAINHERGYITISPVTTYKTTNEDFSKLKSML